MRDFLFFPLGKFTACKELVLKQIFFLCLIFSQAGFFLLTGVTVLFTSRDIL